METKDELLAEETVTGIWKELALVEEEMTQTKVAGDGEFETGGEHRPNCGADGALALPELGYPEGFPF